MKNNLKKLIAVFAFIAAFSNGKAQIEVMASYIYSQDSIAGFDEQAASAGALANACYGREFKVFMYRAKREYVKQKYGIRSLPPVTLFQNPIASRPAILPGGACNNEDFELATSNIVAPNAVQGWTLQSGTNNNSCQQPNLTGSSLYTVYTSPIVDSKVPGTVGSYFDASSTTVPAGNAYIRLNDDFAGAKAIRLSKAFIPTPTSALFQYAYLPVIEDGSHGCCDQAGFNIKVTVTNTVTNTSTLLACPNISVAVPGPACQFTIPPGGPVFNPCIGAPGWSYSNWTASAIDLTQYINYLVRIDVTVVDCNQGGHGAYFYFDAKCGPLTITGNGNAFPAGTPSVTVPTCGAQGATICATPGLGPYSWAGPGVGPQYSTPSMTNQCFTSSLSATYTLYMNPPGSCAPIERVVTATITPAPLLLQSVLQAGCGGTVAVVSVTPSGSAANPSTLIWSPTPLTLNSGTTIGTYAIPPGPNPLVVSITASDPLGCLITQTANVNPAPPSVTFALLNVTGSPSITCSTPSVDISAVTNYTYGSLNYFWSSASFTFTGNQINTPFPGVFTVTAKDPVTNCEAIQQISIGVNTVAPSSTVSPMLQNITCNLSSITTVTTTANPIVNVTHYIMSPFGTTASATSHSMVFIPTIGNYTYVLVNDMNGCTTTKVFTVTSNFGFPTFSVVSSQTLGCNNMSCTPLNITQGNTTPPGGPVSYTILAPGSSSGTPSGALSNISAYTVCVPGTYTVITKDNTSFCETRIPLSVLQKTATPAISAIVDKQVLNCREPKVTLRGQSTTSDVGYNWTFNNTPNTQPGDTLTVYTVLGTVTKTLVDTYTLTITNTVSTCKSTSLIPIYQNLFPPNAAVSGLKAISCLTPSVMLTNGSSTGIPPTTGFPTNSVVTASRWDGPTPQEPKFNSTTYLALTVGVYTMTATDLNNGCTATAQHTIADQRIYPAVNNPAPPPSILDCGLKSTTVTANVTPSTGLTFTWIAPANASVSNQYAKVLTTNAIGEYKLIVYNPQNGCQASGFVNVINGTLTAGFAPDRLTGFAPLTVNFDNTSSSTLGSSGITSIWNFGNGTSRTDKTILTATTIYSQPGTYTVTLYANKGTCLETKQQIINVEIPSALVVPNVFTPNNDGINDLFFLKTSNLAEIDAKIYDRWGHIVYELLSEKGNIAWDGKNQFGQEVAEGTYFYLIKATGNDGQEYDLKGTVSLFR